MPVRSAASIWRRCSATAVPPSAIAMIRNTSGATPNAASAASASASTASAHERIDCRSSGAADSANIGTRIARQPERQQPHEAVGREGDVQRQRGAAIQRWRAEGCKSERQRGGQHHHQAGQCGPAVQHHAGHAARAAQVRRQQHRIGDQRQHHRHGACTQQQRPAVAHAERHGRDAGRVQPPDRRRPARRTHRLARGDRQQLQARADRRHDQHAQRHEVQRGERPAEAAGKAGPAVRAREQRQPGQQVVGDRGAEKAERNRRRQQPARRAREEGARRGLHGSRTSRRRTSPGSPAMRCAIQPTSASSPYSSSGSRSWCTTTARRVGDRRHELQDRHQRLRRREAAHVDVFAVGVAPAPGG